MKRAAENYIFFSKMPRCFDRPMSTGWDPERTRLAFPGIAVPLPAPRLDGGSLATALHERASSRSFEPGRLGLQEISTLLAYSTGLRRVGGSLRGYAPSAGALYPLTCFLSAYSVNGLSPGSYCYDACSHRLTGPRPPLPISCFSEPDVLSSATCILTYVVSLELLARKYGERSLRFALLECGHVAQNVCLMAASLQLSHLCVGGFEDEKIEAHFGLDGRVQHACYAIALG